MCEYTAVEKDGFYGPYSVFPFNIYGNKVTYPAPYFSYDPVGPGQQLLGASEVANPNTYLVFGYNSIPNGYGEGNLIGHKCECTCLDQPQYNTIKNPVNRCWCSGTCCQCSK